MKTEKASFYFWLKEFSRYCLVLEAENGPGMRLYFSTKIL